METWAWLIAYVVAFGLLQLVLYKYFQRENSPDTSPETTPPSTERRGNGGTERPGRDGDPDRDGAVRCRHCGTYNDRHATITFCRRCVQPLH